MRFFLKTSMAALCLAGACATTSNAPGAVQTLAAEDSAAAIRGAEEVGAAHSPAAALHLQLAKEQFERARKLTSPDDRALSGRLMLRSRADADLALALAREDAEKGDVQAATTKLKALNDPSLR
jgi:hypothetical protein